VNIMTSITGNTYPVKEQLKQLGARWNKAQRAWIVADDKAEQAREIVASAPAKRSNRSTSGRSYRSAYGGRCEDAPCCGCCGPSGDGDYYGYQSDGGYDY
jgi:hypothetical protein